jgi:hypothetical protein
MSVPVEYEYSSSKMGDLQMGPMAQHGDVLQTGYNDFD